MIKDYFFLALSNLRHRGLRSWLTMIGIFIGIAAVVSLISLGAGLKEAITGQFSTLATDTLIIQNAGTGFGPPGSTAVKKLTDRDLKIINQVKDIDLIISRLIRIVRLEYNGVTTFVYIANIPNNKEKVDFIYKNFNAKIEQGRLLYPGDKRKIVLGNDFSKKDNQFGKEIRVGSDIVLQGERFEVVGILEKASSFQINSVILILEDDMKEILNIGDEIDLIIVQVKDEKKIESVAKDIERVLRKDRDLDIGEEDFSVQTPIQSLSTVNTFLNIVNLIVSGIAAISLLIGGIGIANTMYTSVLERTKEIGTMKAVGAKNKDILFIFLIESGLLGLVGGIVGTFIGLGMAFAVASAASSALGFGLFKVQVSYYLIATAIILSTTIGIFSGMLPAFQASRLKPVEALRK